jgi:hypothetical protein
MLFGLPPLAEVFQAIEAAASQPDARRAGELIAGLDAPIEAAAGRLRDWLNLQKFRADE